MKVYVDQDGCISCGACEGVCPEVFELVDGISSVKEDADLEGNREGIEQAVNGCPVSVIHMEE